jgi:3-hydroxy-3-methylglutaryl CoA synthase
MPGIASYGAYVPLTRLPLALIAGRTAREGGPEKAIADYDEDAVTMALAAAIDCLGDVDRGAVDALLFASTTYPLREKQGAALIAKALDLRRDVSTADHAGSLRAGTAALESALHAVAAGAARNVLVVASDCRMGAPRGALESKLGDGAVAFLVSDSGVIARFEASHAVADELQDQWRVEGEAFTHGWEDRFVIQEGYTPNLVAAVRGLFEKTGHAPADFARAALYAPDARAQGGVARELGLSDGQIQDALFGRLGNTGTAFAPMLLASALEEATPGQRLLVASYGDGAHALCFETTDAILKLEPSRVTWIPPSGPPAPTPVSPPPSASASATPTSASSPRSAAPAGRCTSRSRACAADASRRTSGRPIACPIVGVCCSPTPSTTSSPPRSRRPPSS